MKAITVGKFGGPEAMEWTTVERPSVLANEVLVANRVAGVNFIDTYHRSGLYPMDLPLIPGVEGAGEIIEIGDEVKDLELGQMVAWTGVLGSYSEFQAIPGDSAVPVPDRLEPEQACAVLLQGLTASYLALDTYPLGPSDTCLIHAGAGGVGLLLTQLAKSLGATVFTTVSTDAKAELSTKAGADHVINYADGSFAREIVEIAGERPFDVVYDGVGNATFNQGLGLIRPRGTMATFGNASGPVDPISPLLLAQNGSLFLTRPTLIDHIPTRSVLLQRAADLFERVVDGALDVKISKRLPLSKAADAHTLIESRGTTGKIILEIE